MGLGFEEFSRVVSRVHLSASDPGTPWEDTFGEIGRHLGATACTLMVDPGDGYEVMATTISPESAVAYQSYYHKLDFIVADCTRGPVGLVRDGWDVVARNSHSEFHADWQRPFEMTDGLFVQLAAPHPTSFVLSAPPSGQPYASAERVRFVNALVPHLQHAIHARHRLGDDLGPVNGMGVFTDASVHGLVVVDQAGRVVQMNRAAERIATVGDGIRIFAQGVRLGTAVGDAELRASIAAAAPHVPNQGPRVGSYVVCGRPSGRRPYVLRVTPLDEYRRGDGHVAIIIVDPTRDVRPPKELLIKLFGLTRAEVEVTLRLLDGDGLQSIADGLALSVSTIKTHVRSVFRKTDTRRQSQLIRLLTAIAS